MKHYNRVLGFFIVKLIIAGMLIIQSVFNNKSTLINQFVPAFCLCFVFTSINFQGILHHVCDVTMTKKYVDQSELVNVGAQINQ